MIRGFKVYTWALFTTNDNKLIRCAEGRCRMSLERLATRHIMKKNKKSLITLHPECGSSQAMDRPPISTTAATFVAEYV